MRDGLYRVHFSTQLGAGAGTLFVRDGKVWGGDSGMFYVGTVIVDGDKLTAHVDINRHTSNNGIVSVFGIDKAQIRLSGTVSGDDVAAVGTSPQAPGMTFKANLNRLSD